MYVKRKWKGKYQPAKLLELVRATEGFPNDGEPWLSATTASLPDDELLVILGILLTGWNAKNGAIYCHAKPATLAAAVKIDQMQLARGLTGLRNRELLEIPMESPHIILRLPKIKPVDNSGAYAALIADEPPAIIGNPYQFADGVD